MQKLAFKELEMALSLSVNDLQAMLKQRNLKNNDK
jgi:hypothetical protein